MHPAWITASSLCQRGSDLRQARAASQRVELSQQPHQAIQCSWSKGKARACRSPHEMVAPLQKALEMPLMQPWSVRKAHACRGPQEMAPRTGRCSER